VLVLGPSVAVGPATADQPATGAASVVGPSGADPLPARPGSLGDHGPCGIAPVVSAGGVGPGGPAVAQDRDDDARSPDHSTVPVRGPPAAAS
jgi:hypothetical protein